MLKIPTINKQYKFICTEGSVNSGSVIIGKTVEIDENEDTQEGLYTFELSGGVKRTVKGKYINALVEYKEII